MKLGRWSTAAASNNNTPPDGWPEGQAPSTVNDCAREMMAAIRTVFNDAQFFDQDFTPTYVSATSFTVPGDQTSAIHAGRRLKLYDATAGVATTIYATVATASFTTVTTISVANDAGQLTSSLSSFAIAILSNSNNSLPRSANTAFDRISASAIEATTLTASGAVVLKGTLSVSGQAGFTNLLTTGNPVFGRGATDAQLTIAGSSVTTASGMALLVRSTSPTRLELVRGDAAVAYDMLLANMELGGTLTVGGATTLKGALSVGGAAVLGSTLAISGAATLAGTLTVSGALSVLAGQIAFPAVQNASADANTLDDYEEGDWTAAMSALGGGSIILSVSAMAYTKKGREVTVTGTVTVSAVSAPSGQLRITGLPFTCGAGAKFDAPVSIHPNGLTTSATTAIVGHVVNNSSAIAIWKYQNGGIIDVAADVQAGTTLKIAATYFV